MDQPIAPPATSPATQVPPSPKAPAERVEDAHNRLVDVEQQLVGVQNGASSFSLETVTAIVDGLAAVVREMIDLIRTPPAS